MFERVDMALFGTLPGLIRISILVEDLRPDPPSAAAAALLAAMGRRAGADGSWPAKMAPWQGAYADLGLESSLPPPNVLAAWAAAPSGVPSLGALADVVNAFSLQHGVPTAAYDVGAVEGGLWLRPSRGCEIFWGLSDTHPISPPINEFILVDSADRVLARRWHGEQGRDWVVSATTGVALVHLDLLPPLSAASEELAAQLARLVLAYAADSVRVQRLDWDHPQVTWRRG